MHKIPTLYVRDPQNMARVTDVVTPGCEWVINGEGAATRKWDGTNIRLAVRGGAVLRVEKRRNPSREEKAEGVEPGYVMADRADPSDKHIWAAVDGSHEAWKLWPDGEWPCEALGPKIQGGAEKVMPSLVAFSLPSFISVAHIQDVPTTPDGLKWFLGTVPWEGVVWHHPDGRMAKIKRRDFGIEWPVKGSDR